MSRLTDVSIFEFYHDPNNLSIDRNMGPRIELQCLFGKHNLRDLLEEYVLETLLSWVENIFQLRMVIKDDKDENIVKSIIEKLARTRSFTTKKEYKQKIGHIMEIIK